MNVAVSGPANDLRVLGLVTAVRLVGVTLQPLLRPDSRSLQAAQPPVCFYLYGDMPARHPIAAAAFVLRNPYARNLPERHRAALERVCDLNASGFFYAELAGVADLLQAAAEACARAPRSDLQTLLSQLARRVYFFYTTVNTHKSHLLLSMTVCMSHPRSLSLRGTGISS